MTEIGTTGTTTSALTFQSTTFDVIDQNGQPWLRAPQIAQALGYSDESSINRIYARRAKEFTDSMTCTVKLTDQVQDRETRIFSLRGSHLLGMFARTEIAAQFRNWILDILEGKAKQPALLPTDTITPSQAQHLKELVDLVVESGKQGYPDTWSRLHRKMKVNSYLNLRQDQFDAAVEYLKGKFDDTSLAAIAAKHFPQLALPAPVVSLPSPITTDLFASLVQGNMIDHGALIKMQAVINQKVFITAFNNKDRGIGAEIAAKVKDMSPADLYAVNVAANMEVWLRTLQSKTA